LQRGKCATAIEYYKKVRLQEYKVKSLKKILDCTMMEKDYRTALSVIEELIKNKSVKEKDELLLQREWIRFKLGKYRDSIAYLTGFIKKYPSSKLVPSLRLKIASILLENKKFYQAIHELQKIREKYPEYTSQANLLLAKAKEEMGDYKGALKVLQNVQDPEILLKRARIKEKLGMYGEALTDIIAARKKFPCIADEMLGNIYRKLGRKKEATLVFLRVYRQCRKQAYNAFLQLCEIEIEEGSFKRVKEMLKEGIKRFGNTPEILYLNALKERMEGNFENAYLQLTEALSKETSLNWKIKIINALTMIAVPIDKKEEVKKILEEEAKSSEDPLYRGRIKDILKKFK